jgi:murein DD-endopeptidase MepM/ murein hydrolase activator NlpD
MRLSHRKQGMSKPLPKYAWIGRSLFGVILAFGLSLWVSPRLNASATDIRSQEAAQSIPTVHVVAAGETLSAIAAHYGVTTAALVEANKLGNPDRLAIGQRLLIPSPAGPDQAVNVRPRLRYLVQPAETWDSLAKKFRIAKRLLKQTNISLSKMSPEPGSVIEVPVRLDFSTLGIGRFEIVPAQPQQGDAAAVVVSANRPLTIAARYSGEDLAPVEGGVGRVWALFGIHPFAAPGLSWLDVDMDGLDLPTWLRSEPDDQRLHLRWPVPVQPGRFETQHLVLPADKGELLNPSLVARERNALNIIWPQHDLAPQWTGVFTRPLSSEFQVTSPFGTRRSYNGGPVASFHEGQDFGAPAGTVVVAPAPGVVVLAETLAVRGNAVILDHGAGLHTGYWHLSQIAVEVGQQVKRGEKIGEVGTTGLSTGAHLHWEMRIGMTPVNPLTWLERVLPE